MTNRTLDSCTEIAYGKSWKGESPWKIMENTVLMEGREKEGVYGG